MRKITKTIPHLCPVCKGTGYQTINENTVVMKRTTCNACNGLGFIFATETIEEDCEPPTNVPTVPANPYPWIPNVPYYVPYRHDQWIPYSPPDIWCDSRAVMN